VKVQVPVDQTSLSNSPTTSSETSTHRFVLLCSRVYYTAS